MDSQERDEGVKNEPERTLLLHDNFVFKRRLGKGTFGTAWLALDKSSSHDVVLKLQRKERTSRTCFKRELRYAYLAGQHPHVASTWKEGFETSEYFLMVQEFADGGDLFREIQTDRSTLTQVKCLKTLQE